MQFIPKKATAYWFNGQAYETEVEAMEACRQAFIRDAAVRLDCGEAGEGVQEGVERVLRLLLEDAPDQFDAAMAAIEKARADRENAAAAHRMSRQS